MTVTGEALAETLRIATDTIADLEGGLTAIHREFGEPYYSWQRVLYRVQQVIHRRNACAEACLNTLGYLRGHSEITTTELAERLSSAVSPIVGDDDELPQFTQVPPTRKERDQLIDANWLASIGGLEQTVPSQPTQGRLTYWDFPIVTEHSQSTFLRIHEPDSDGEWAVDLFDRDGNGVGIVNWPRTREQFRQLAIALGVIST